VIKNRQRKGGKAK